MELQEILRQPEGFTPPDVTVKIEKVYAYKTGTGQDGHPWSFQDVKVNGGTLKLKNIMHELPASRVGQTVTLRAKSSQQHGLTGLKVAHEQYQGNTYDKLIVTGSAIWEWGAATNGNTAQNGHAPARNDALSPETYADHLLSVAELANVVTAKLEIEDPVAIQACFATICIDAKQRGLMLPKPKTLASGATSEPADDTPPAEDPFSEDDPPF